MTSMNKEYEGTYKLYKEYKQKYRKLVIKRLEKSIYPTQVNDFYFLTLPKGHPNAGKEVPVDYKLRNLVQYFWDLGLITYGWDQGWEIYGCKKCFEPSFISFTNKDKNDKYTIKTLKRELTKIFGKENIRISIIRYINWTKEEFKRRNDKIFNYLNKNSEKIIIEMYSNHIRINFRNGYLMRMHEMMNIPMPSGEDRCPGGLIKYDTKYYTQSQ